ncbi:lipopolysaccharide biosynthesis glycosyltransferase [Mucilaginibacter gracilis]|uniref:Lipopolysaccharide biosynthesis glycosyltransferase n=1 Tax=Mucilaginibacter gracilis TaxID=423350 RepID=A0A495J775_9SPHI|nr:glycosyltransferase family 8 protein [Mucilaginibacter gracilis]RKR84224.1 lipopolysaccharide biosynthesis glycosyltransferase [Mucilaginibacter gracilis]
MTSPNVIPIVVVTDEHYVIMLAALLKSIEVNHKTGEKIAVYVIADGVKQKSQRRIKASVDAAMFTINWIKMENTIPAGVKLPLDHTSYPVTIYLRLFIPYIVPKETTKALFLDVDMIVLDDVSKLYNQDLGDNIIGAVQDPRLLTFDNAWGGIMNYKELGFAADTKYFNTGLLLINTQKWAEQNLAQKVIDCINANIKHANYPDQYGYNVVLANQWLELDTRWNYFSSGNLETPFIIHFISRKPFYTTYEYNPKYKSLFYQYLKLTEWRNAKPIGELNRYLKKLKNIWIKIKKKV